MGSIELWMGICCSFFFFAPRSDWTKKTRKSGWNDCNGKMDDKANGNDIWLYEYRILKRLRLGPFEFESFHRNGKFLFWQFKWFFPIFLSLAVFERQLDDACSATVVFHISNYMAPSAKTKRIPLFILFHMQNFSSIETLISIPWALWKVKSNEEIFWKL